MKGKRILCQRLNNMQSNAPMSGLHQLTYTISTIQHRVCNCISLFRNSVSTCSRLHCHKHNKYNVSNSNTVCENKLKVGEKTEKFRNKYFVARVVCLYKTSLRFIFRQNFAEYVLSLIHIFPFH